MRVLHLALFTTAVGALACQRSNGAVGDSAIADTATAAIADSSRPAVVSDSTLPGAPPATTPATPTTGTGAQPPAVADPLSMPRPDTARGIVRIVGSEPMTTLTLSRSANALETLSLIGASQALLRNLTGVEVTIIGRQTSDRDMMASPRGAFKFMVDSFVVRASDGVAAHDGVLEQTGGRYFLRLRDGSRQAITTLPAALREHVGSRIYVVGDVATPATWGIIQSR